MTRFFSGAAVCAGAFILVGCGGANHQKVDGTANVIALPVRPNLTPDNILATVNGRPIARSALKQQQQHRQGLLPEDSQRDELVQREILRQEAEKQNLLADPGVVERLDNAVRMVISQAAAEHYIETVAISDEDIGKEYAERIAAMKKTEYKARHILVDSETKAREAIARLGKGTRFEDVARKLSTDQGSKDQGGDLGWFAPEQMVEPFSSAVAALKNGETTQTPIQTSFGWHVIRRDDSREQQAPALEQVKDQIRMMLQTNKFQQYIDDLKKTAQIEVMAASGKLETPPAASKAAPATVN